jgi:hypothetical protein
MTVSWREALRVSIRWLGSIKPKYKPLRITTIASAANNIVATGRICQKYCAKQIEHWFHNLQHIMQQNMIRWAGNEANGGIKWSARSKVDPETMTMTIQITLTNSGFFLSE